MLSLKALSRGCASSKLIFIIARYAHTLSARSYFADVPRSERLAAGHARFSGIPTTPR